MLLLRDCCCMFVPCYRFDDEEEYVVADGGATAATLLPPYRLPPDWEPLAQYRVAFDRLDAQFEAALESASDTQPLERVDPARVARALQCLGSGQASAQEARTHFNLLRLAVRAEPPSSAEREQLIGAYELYRAVYSADDRLELNQASWALAQAHQSEIGAAQRIQHYQRALYHTHRAEEKAALRREYVEYCESLK